jgi:quercetin dioxygenase-like cupin family protein
MNEMNKSGNMLDMDLQGFIFANNIEWENVGDGIQRKILGFDENLMMTLVNFKKNSRGTIHSHPHRQVTYIIRGSFEVQIEDEKRILKQGDSFFILPSILHGVMALDDALLVEVFSPLREDFLNK